MSLHDGIKVIQGDGGTRVLFYADSVMPAPGEEGERDAREENAAESDKREARLLPPRSWHAHRERSR